MVNIKKIKILKKIYPKRYKMGKRLKCEWIIKKSELQCEHFARHPKEKPRYCTMHYIAETERKK